MSDLWKVVSGEAGIGAHYTIMCPVAQPENTMESLRIFFEDGANEMNFILFSTSGVHGTYTTIEDAESEPGEAVTFLIVQPRIVCLRYGQVVPKTKEDFDYLKKLRQQSWKIVNSIGKP
jgi:hypothetical protein